MRAKVGGAPDGTSLENWLEIKVHKTVCRSSICKIGQSYVTRTAPTYTPGIKKIIMRCLT